MYLTILWIPQENICVGVFFNKAADLKACNSIKERLQHNFFSVKFAKFLRTSFFKKSPWLLLRFQLMFSKELGAKAGATVSNKYQILLEKKYLLPRKSRSSHGRCSVKKDLHRCFPMNIAKFLRTWKTSANGCFWKSALQRQIYQREVTPDILLSF